MCCIWLFLKNDVYAKYINLEKSGLKKSKKKEEKHWLAMLCEQTEERGNFIIFTSLAVVYAFNCRSYILNYRRVSFLRKKKCWKINKVCRWHVSQLQVTKVNIFYFGIFYHVFTSDSWDISKCGSRNQSWI